MRNTKKQLLIMKKPVLFFTFLFISIQIFAIDFNFNFGFKQQDSVDKYQQYVGQQIIVRDAYGESETWEKSGFKPNEKTKNMIFTITMIQVKDIKLKDKPNKEIKIEAIQVGGNKKINFKCYEEPSIKHGFYGGIKIWPQIGRMPIILVEAFNEFKSEIIGSTITHTMVKDQFEIVDAFIGDPLENYYGRDAQVCIKVKNMRTNEIQNCYYSRRYDAPFTKALEGKYKTALVRVEKPEDASNRYSETKIITDSGIEKYSFNDSTINILIYGTSESFYFELKNVSSNSLKIIWNEAGFVGLDGNTSKIMHKGITYSQREGDQPATTVIRGAKIEDLVCPTANVYYRDNGIGRGWNILSMLPYEFKGKDIGEIRLMLPIQIKDVVNEYIFVFKAYYIFDNPELLNPENL